MLEKDALKILFDELVELQKKKVLECGRRVIPYVTSDDLLQPNDFPELENHPHFRYEEGILDGLQVARASFFSWVRERELK